jgi:CubicO group peptidase (beta-lactamase class C family)
MTTKSAGILIALVVVSLLSLSVQAAASRQLYTVESIDTYVRERMAALGAPGAAVAVVRDGEVIHLAGYGVADTAGTPVTSQTPFLLASLSKSMTAVAVLQLVEQGLVELDAPIQTYLPWFMPDTPITVRQLLNQTSGLDELDGYQRNLDPGGPDGLGRSIRRLAETELNRPPGSAFEYSNSNADTLGLLIQTVTGQPYADYMVANVFAPLGMTGATTSLEDARAAGMSRAFYPFFGRQTALDAFMAHTTAVQPSAGIIASATDMVPYLQMHLTGGRAVDAQLLAPASVAMLHAPAVAINPEGEARHAMGWFVWPFPEANPGGEPPTALSHGGDWLGAKSMMLLIPQRDLGVFTVMSGGDDATDPAFDNVIFNVALLALGLQPSLPEPQVTGLDAWWRWIGVGLILYLLAAAVWAARRLRGHTFSGRAAWAFVALAAIDVALTLYFLLVQLPANLTTVPLMLRFGPDLGLMLVIVLLFTVVWGTIRSLWAGRRWWESRSA